MSDNKINELLNYFRLCSYRDGEYFLEDEYYELEGIIKRNEVAKYLEEIRYKYLTNQMTEEEYNNICNDYYNKLILKKF
jgi:hypothetical protein